MKKGISAILIALIILTGLSLFLYPSVSNYLSERGSSEAISRYADNVDAMESGDCDRELSRAEEFNRALYLTGIDREPTSVSASDYEYLLNISGDGMMSYVEIPAINCRLPVYHGTDAATLESYIGHLPSSSLPVGGESTHCVLTGHTGVPSAKLLTDLDKLRKGDRFTLTTLGRTLTYEVDNILVVRPDETDALRIQPGQDYCTLVTCTPYGVNTHRLLVRGRRISGDETRQAAEDSSLVDMLYGNPVMIALAGLLLILMISYAATKIHKA